MRVRFLSALLLAGVVTTGNGAEFKPPLRLMAADQPVRVENPGWAAPCWADIDSDGKKDLLVGQFNQGKINVYKNLGGGKLAPGAWLKADGIDAEIPGVW
jgi:hypothetical protein